MYINQTLGTDLEVLLRQYPTVEKIGFQGLDKNTKADRGIIQVFAEDCESHSLAVLCDKLCDMYAKDVNSEIAAAPLGLNEGGVYDICYLKGVDW